MNDFEQLLKEEMAAKNAIRKEKENPQVPFCNPFTAKEMQRADKSCSLYDCLTMIGLIVKNTMDDLNVDFVPHDKMHTLVEDPDYAQNHPFISFKVISRKPLKKYSYKPIVGEILQEHCDNQTRAGMRYSMNYDCIVQFNFCAPEYSKAWKIMDRFELLMNHYIGHIKKQGVKDCYFHEQLTDDYYDTFREKLSILNLQYHILIENIEVIFNEEIKDIITHDVSDTNQDNNKE